MIRTGKILCCKKNNRYLLLFIAFSGEELGLVGSESLAQQLNLKLIKAVINLEMLGRPLRNRCYAISSKKTAVAKVLNRQLNKYDTQAKSDFFLNDIFPGESLFYRSDHYPFAKKVKNAFTIMGSSPEDQYYHTVDDEYSNIDFNFLLLATKNIALSCNYFIE
ncbi:MAG: M28 family peptidase [Chitinophagaceae bacterium]|nr:M28 family peptidase [Chitinophagaceae bacterium]